MRHNFVKCEFESAAGSSCFSCCATCDIHDETPVASKKILRAI